MDDILFLIAAVPILMIIGIVVAIARGVSLQRRVAKLEKRLALLETPSAAERVPSAAEPAAAAVATPPPEVVDQPQPTKPEPAPAPKKKSSAYVLRAENLQRLKSWLSENWVLGVAALSLILGGLFLVQYGVEHGLLTPAMRVAGALAMAGLFVAGGEFLRRRHGDQNDATMRHLPSTLSGAGIVVAFITVLSAHRLYDMIGPLPALGGLALLSVGAVLAGWFYGPLLSAVGLLGAGAAPFLVAGSSADAGPLYPYMALVGLTGLGIDSVKRWAWVSVLALVVASGGLALLWLGAPHAPGLALSALALAFGAIVIPSRQLTPQHDGPWPLAWRSARPEFPTLVAGAGGLILTGAILTLGIAGENEAEVLLGVVLALIGSAAAVLWLKRAPALEVLAALPAGAFLVTLAVQGWTEGPLLSAFWAGQGRPPETAAPMQVWWLTVSAAILSGLAIWRLHAPVRDSRWWSLAAALILPGALLLMEFLWWPGEILGGWPWAVTVMTAAAAMVGLSSYRARLGGERLALETGFLAASALVLIALALFLLMSKAALTVALSLLVVLAVAIDRRWPMPPMSWIVQLGAAVLGYRMVVDPGPDWAIDASWLDFVLGYGAPLAAFAAARWLVRPERALLQAVTESAALVSGGMLLTLTLARAVGMHSFNSQWGAGLTAAIWASISLAQLWRLRHARGLVRLLRIGFAVVSTLAAVVTSVALISETLRLLGPYPGLRVLGPPVFDSLALAILPLAFVLGFGAWKVVHARYPRLVLMVASGGLVALWGWLEIRRLWRGAQLGAPGPSDGELYSYTVAMLAVSVAMLALAVWKRSDLIRRLAMAGVALTIAKVFLIDMSGLSGLTRVVSFVGLGLALVGLAWLNRVINRAWGRD